MDRPLFLLGAQPIGKVTARRFFDAASGSVIDLLKNPPVTRSHGWDMRTLDEPRLVEGKCLEVGCPDYKLLRVYRDGTVLFRGVADEDLLGWGQREGEEFAKRPRLNPIVITELAYHFVQLVGETISRLDSVPDEYEVTCGLRGAKLASGEMLYVTPYEVDMAAWTIEMVGETYPAQEETFDCAVTAPVSILRGDPARVAAEVLEEFYVRFGMPTDRLPYVESDADGVRRVRVPVTQ